MTERHLIGMVSLTDRHSDCRPIAVAIQTARTLGFEIKPELTVRESNPFAIMVSIFAERTS